MFQPPESLHILLFTKFDYFFIVFVVGIVPDSFLFSACFR